MRRASTVLGSRRVLRSIVHGVKSPGWLVLSRMRLCSLRVALKQTTLQSAGLCEASETHGRHIITSAIEHPSVAGVCLGLEKRGWEVTRLPVYANGIVRLEDVAGALRPDTVLITIMLANNEIGTIQPISQIGAFVREKRAAGQRNLWLHTDAVQAAGRLALNVDELGCDLLTLSAHKLYAPKGVGALYVRRGVRLHGQNVGGHQERERRAGTENVPGIVAFGEAAKLAREEREQRLNHDRALRDRFEAEVRNRIRRCGDERRSRTTTGPSLEYFVSVH